MAIHRKLYIIQCLPLLLSYVCAMAPADPSHTELSHAKSHQYSVSYRVQSRDFPNERLYLAYLAIQRFKGTITSDPKNITKTWTGHDICGKTTYLGFYCATLPGPDTKLTVTEVLFNGFGLSAPKLQGFVDQLPDLVLFHAASNNFGSDVPLLAGLDYRYEFNIADDITTTQRRPREEPRAEADGTIAGSGHMGHCLNAYLNFTFHIGAGSENGGLIPFATSARALLLNYNNISGPLPKDLGSSKLSYLALANNKLTGPIPPSISHLQNSLFEVLLLSNQLSGCLPHELGKLTKATVIDAGKNQLTGPIPSSFSCLTSVEQLNLGSNHLYGDIPDALCKLAGASGRLANLTLSNNYFTSVSPACAALIKDGVLDVKNNCIPGLANQRRAAECASFQTQPKACPAPAATASCPAAAAKNAVAPEGRVVPKDYSSYVTYATLHE